VIGALKSIESSDLDDVVSEALFFYLRTEIGAR